MLVKDQYVRQIYNKIKVLLRDHGKGPSCYASIKPHPFRTGSIAQCD